jgi:hypothetical protein
MYLHFLLYLLFFIEKKTLQLMHFDHQNIIARHF